MGSNGAVGGHPSFIIQILSVVARTKRRHWGRHETSPSPISASGSRCRRAPAVSRIARAESYPSRPVRIVVGFPPGGPSDIGARLIGQWLSERFGQPFIIENRPGASTNIATEVAVQASADGYTLLLVLPSAAINATLYDKLHFNFIHDIAPIGSIMRAPYVLVINPSVPAKTLPELFPTRKPILARSRWRPRALALEAT